MLCFKIFNNITYNKQIKLFLHTGLSAILQQKTVKLSETRISSLVEHHNLNLVTHSKQMTKLL